jgi:hypothetical protein
VPTLLVCQSRVSISECHHTFLIHCPTSLARTHSSERVIKNGSLTAAGRFAVASCRATSEFEKVSFESNVMLKLRRGVTWSFAQTSKQTIEDLALSGGA